MKEKVEQEVFALGKLGTVRDRMAINVLHILP